MSPIDSNLLEKRYPVQFAHEKPEQYSSEILRIVSIEKIDYLLILSDVEAYALTTSEMKNQLSRLNCKCLLPSHSFIELCSSKHRFFDNWLLNCATKDKHVLIESNKALIRASKLYGYPSRMFIIKPSRASGSRGVYLVDANSDSQVTLLGLANNRISLEMLIRMNIEWKELDFIGMPYYPGKDYNIDVLCYEGRVLYSLIQERLKPNFGAIVEAKIVDDIKIRNLINSFIEKYKVSGMINIECAKDNEGKPKIYEVNPRPSAALAFSYAFSVDIIGELINIVNNKPNFNLPIANEGAIIKRVSKEICEYNL
ncbi:ATP-grasp domain-containing protein [Synechococcus sp. KORDI-100]|uniref:ATP-grasp domain-containing protein n=1 Tax=Synechococcus sp. KORDI-100 TaxID=1280380 RepID=UPI0012E09F09|nr:ATP-grasp domain-containing protein [Synechococcus sp. KORDI-100]